MSRPSTASGSPPLTRPARELTLVKSLMRSAARTPFCTLKLMSTFTSVKESVSLMMGTWGRGQ